MFPESLGREVALEQCLSPRARSPEVGKKDQGGAASGVNRVLLSNSVGCHWKVPGSLRSSEDKDPGCMKEKWRCALGSSGEPVKVLRGEDGVAMAMLLEGSLAMV